jgi:hypothetical protein
VEVVVAAVVGAAGSYFFPASTSRQPIGNRERRVRAFVVA